MLTFPVTVSVCMGLIVALCVTGRLLRRRGGERAFRYVIAGLTLAAWVAMQTVYFWPGNFDPKVSWPLHICDIVAVIGPLAVLMRNRVLLGVLYFWGIGLTTQAFITPVLPATFGPSSIWYWTFWSNHTIVVGLAVYSLLVLGYRPSFRDLVTTVALTLVWMAVVIPLNIAIGSNYGYLSPELPNARTLLNDLGGWPARAFVMSGIVLVGFVVLWLPWGIAGRLTAKAGRRQDAKT